MARIFEKSGVRFFSFWLEIFSFPEPKEKLLRATFLGVANHRFFGCVTCAEIKFTLREVLPAFYVLVRYAVKVAMP